MRSQEEALLQAIRADPDSDVLRLVYADWLQEHAPELAGFGEFIQLSCRLSCTEDDIARLAARRDSLIRSHGEGWIGPFSKEFDVQDFERGFCTQEEIRVPANLLEHVDDLFRLAPLSSIVLYEVSKEQVEQICGMSIWHRYDRMGVQGAELDAAQCELLADAPNLSHLLGLDLSGCSLTDDGLRILCESPNFRQLKHIDLHETELCRPNSLAVLHHLESLDLSSTKVCSVAFLQQLVDDLEPLSGLVALESLHLAGTSVSDLDPLEGLTALTWLSLSRAPVTNLSALRGLFQLEHLDLDYTQVEDLSPLAKLRALERLDAICTPLRDLEPLRDMQKLWCLALNNTQVESLGPLSNMRKLELLELLNANVADLAPLVGLKKLAVLELGGTRVEDLLPLAELFGLEQLGLNNTVVTDLRPLSNLRSLEYLSLSGTGVQDVRPLAALSNLSSLILAGTSVSARQIDWLKNRLPNLKVVHGGDA